MPSRSAFLSGETAQSAIGTCRIRGKPLREFRVEYERKGWGNDTDLSPFRKSQSIFRRVRAGGPVSCNGRRRSRR